MSITTVRPNADVSLWGDYFIVGGTATAAEALADNSDGTYVQAPTSAGLILGYPAPSLPAGEQLKEARLRARVNGICSLRYISILDAAFPDQYFSTFLPVTVELGRTPLSSVPATRQTRHDLYSSYGGSCEVYATYLDFVTVAKPVIQAFLPSEGNTITTNLPTFTWNQISSDPEGGPMAAFQVRIFNAAQYGIGGFDPATSPAYDDSGIVNTVTTGSHKSEAPREWQADGPLLVNDTYRFYVRQAQKINGVLWWSGWDYNQFTVNAPLPGLPTLTATAEDTNHRIRLNSASTAGGVSTDSIEIQRSYDGGTTWEDVRTVLGDGLVASGAQVTYDYESANGATATYRARSSHSYGAIGTVYSDWTASVSAHWTDAENVLLKHPSKPNLNTVIVPVSPATDGVETQSRQAVHQPLGSKEAIGITDTAAPSTGVLRILTDDLSTDDAIALMLEDGAPLLIQYGPDDDEPDRWLSINSRSVKRVVDIAERHKRFIDLPWTEVSSPGGGLA